VTGWESKTPTGFIFLVKVPQTATHDKFLKECGSDFSQFINAIQIEFCVGPGFVLDFSTGGVGGELAFASKRVPTTSPNPRDISSTSTRTGMKIAIDAAPASPHQRESAHLGI
jgi:hypothetical protein